MADLQASFAGLPMQHPVMVASGCFAYGEPFVPFGDSCVPPCNSLLLFGDTSVPSDDSLASFCGFTQDPKETISSFVSDYLVQSI